MFHALATWVHNLDPLIFEVWDGFGPRWYGLAYITGLIAGWYIVKRWAEQRRVPIEAIAVQDLAVYFGMGMIIGGRVGYCLFYDTTLLGFTSAFPFWRLLAVWEGGMASHGGIIGMFIGVLLFCRKNSINFLVIADASAVVTPVGIFAGRLANFINGELWGRPTDVAWGIKFPESFAADKYIVQEQFIQANGNPKTGSSDYYTLVELFQTGRDNAIERLQHIAPGSEEWLNIMNTYVATRHPSQLYAAFLEGILVLTIGMICHRLHRRPGVSLGIILSIYSVVRFINEFWRNPDAGYELYLGWMSKGQLLSIPLLGIGLFFIIWAYSRGSKPDIYALPPETTKK